MTPARRLTLLATGLAVLGFVLWSPWSGRFVDATDPGTAGGPGGGEALSQDETPSKLGEATLSGAQVGGEPARRDARAEERAGFGGTVTLKDGRPVAEGTEVQWITKVAAPSARGLGGWTGAAGPLGAETTRAGKFRFDRAPGDPESAIFVALGTGFIAAASPVEPRATIEVEEHAPLIVTVVDGSGTPVHATVEWMGSVALGGRRYLVGGRVEEPGSIPLLPGTFRLEARTPDRCSAPWWGNLDRAGDRVTLTLGEVFEVSAEVHGDADGLELTVRGPGAAWDETAALYAIPRSGKLSPQPVAWMGAGRYTFRLSGEGIVPEEEARDLSSPNEPVHLEFETDGGIGIVLRIEDEEGTRLEGVRAHLIWQSSAGWVRAVADSNQRGEASFPHVPMARYWVRAYADGFVNEAHGPWDIFEQPEADVLVQLRHGAGLRGVVLAGGEPVDRFTVVHRQAGSTSRSIEPFRDRNDGSFELLTLPPGEIEVLATGEAGTSQLHSLSLTEGETQDVVLELESPRPCRGRVLDSRTRTPIAGALIQPWVAPGARAVVQAFGSARTDSDGVFEGLLVPREGKLQVTADGYAEQWQDPVESGEVGLISLTRLRDLQVQLIGPPGTDFTLFQVGCNRSVDSQAVPVDSAGRATLSLTSGGLVEVSVHVPGPSRIDALVDLTPGHPWEVRIPVGTESLLNTRLRWKGAAEDRPETLWMMASFTGEDGTRYSKVKIIEEDGTCSFSCASGSSALLCVRTSEGAYLGSRSVTLTSPGEWIEVEASAEWDRSITLTGAGAGPLAGATVVLRPKAGPPSQNIGVGSDGQGRVPVGHFGDVPVEIAIAHPAGWLSNWRTITEEDTELIFEGSASLTVRLKDQNGPVSGLPIRLSVPGLPSLSFLRTADEVGEVHFDRLEPGTYRLQIQGDGWWPEERKVDVSVGESQVVLAPRRRGGLKFHLTRKGLPVQGVQVDLVSLSEGDDLAQWVAAGEVSLADTTDLQGSASLLGAPAGSYRWVALGAGEGVVELIGGQTTQVEIALP